MDLFKKILLLSTSFLYLGLESYGMESTEEENKRNSSLSLESHHHQHPKSNFSAPSQKKKKFPPSPINDNNPLVPNLLSNHVVASQDTFEKIDEISFQISKIKEIYNKIDSTPLEETSLLREIKESLYRISWRVEEIPSYDKFRMGTFFPEKNWIYLGYLSNALNDSHVKPQQLEKALHSLSKGIEEIVPALPLIKKFLNGELKEEEKKKIQLPCLENFVSFFLDKLLLEKIKNSIGSIIYHINAENVETFIQNEENRRAIFRVFEVMGEGTKYISGGLKDLYPNIPWSSLSSESKKNSLTIIRNKFHHDREKIELVFKYEKDLFKSILETVFPYVLEQIMIISKEYEFAYQQLDPMDFGSLRSSVHSKILAEHGKVTNSPSSEDTGNNHLSSVREILQRIVHIMFKQEDATSTLRGWAVKDLLSYIQEDDDSVYKILFKISALPNTEEEFIDFIRGKAESSVDFTPPIEDKFRKAYSRLQGRKISQKQIEEAFQPVPGVIPVSTIKEEIRKIILGGTPCKADDFRKQFLRPLFFKGKEQKEGEEELEKLRALVSTDISPDKIEKVFELSEEDTQKVHQHTLMALEESNKVKETLKDIASLPKNKVTNKDISKLIGLSNEDQKTLWEILAKAPAVNVESPEVRKKFSNLLTIKENIIKKLEGEETVIRNGKAIKIKITQHDLNNLMGLETEERNKIGIICGLQSSKRTNGQKENVFEILSKIPTTLEKYLEIPSDEQRTLTDIQTVEEILRKTPTTEVNLKILQQENAQKIKDILFKREICTPKAQQEAYFTLLVDTLYYPKDVVNKIQAKYRKILFLDFDGEEQLNAILGAVDENICPLIFLREVIENEWLSSQKEPHKKNEYLKDLEKQLRVYGVDFKSLYEKKRDHTLTPEDINEAIKKLEGEIKKLSELNNNGALSEKKNAESKKVIHKIMTLKEDIKYLPFLWEKNFQDLVEKAGYVSEGKFKDLYQKITYKGGDEPPLGRLKRSLFNNIKKLDSVFEELGNESVGFCRNDVLKMAAEYLIEEVGLLADKLVKRKDYAETSYLATSKRHLYLVSTCRNAMAHYPMALDESLFEYLIDQLVLDTKLRFAQNQSSVEIFAEDISFEKNRTVTWGELEQKWAVIYATVEGLGFKSDFKIFGKTLGCDVGPQGDLNLFVERYDNGEINKMLHNLVELETRLSRVLNCEVRAYTQATLEKRLEPKITSAHLQEIKDHATHTLESVILGNTYVRIFQEDRWSSFKTPEGRIFTRSEFLEQQDLTTLFDFLLGAHFSHPQLENFLNDKEKLQEIVQEKLSLYNSAPTHYAPALKKIVKILSRVISLYETNFQCIYFPVEKREDKIHYKYFYYLKELTNEEQIFSEDLCPKWRSEEFQKLPSSMRCLYVLREEEDGSPVWIKWNEIFKEPLDCIRKGENTSELLRKDIMELLHGKKNTILEKLSPKNTINEKTIFRAITVDYAIPQNEIEENRKIEESFKKQRLEENCHLQRIIKEKSLNYYKNLQEQLSLFSPELKELILQYVLIDKKIDKILIEVYKKREEEFTILWQIMDKVQTSVASHLSKCDDTKNILLSYPNLNISFLHFKSFIYEKLDSLKNEKLKPELFNLLSELHVLTTYIRLDLLKTFCPLDFQNDVVAIIQYFKEHVSNERLRVKDRIENAIFNINIFHPQVRKIWELTNDNDITQWRMMFFPLRDPDVIRCFLDNEDPIKLIYTDFFGRYCQKEDPCTTFIRETEEYHMRDFFSEVENANYQRKEKIEERLKNIPKQIVNKKHYRKKATYPLSLRKPVKKLLNEGKDVKLRRDETILCGFPQEVNEICNHITAALIRPHRDFLKLGLRVDDFPHFISQNKYSHVHMALGRVVHHTSPLSDDIIDLHHLMQIYGWSEEDKENYKFVHNFDQDNNIIKEFFSFVRLSKVLKSAKLRGRAYGEKLADLQEKREDHLKSYPAFQQKKIATEHDLYSDALERNLRSLVSLEDQLMKHPHLQRKVSEALRDPDFLYDLHYNCQHLSNKEIEELIEDKRKELETKALREIRSIG